MAEPTYTESFIRLHATPQSYERGVAYYYDGSVLSMERRGDELVGQVEGSQYEPYQVRITFTGDTLESAFCDCPYEWGGWCKHVVAVLMAALKRPLRQLGQGCGRSINCTSCFQNMSNATQISRRYTSQIFSPSR